ncbi:MAG TPA: SUMF1/EgtB/PvdO family nonheme iron enzyme, partial [Crenalkalicoccus sp.]|nr:SUMF1/EgtB/PvdO family nonheme iron enzyme [Crenalkalicoccus sp.]
TCPTPSLAGRAPQADIAWHEAVVFTVRLSSWLARNARDALPKQEDALGFLRLPTEEEWEFAARGGAAVSEADFGARTPPMPEGLQRHAWYQGSRSAAGRARPVGGLEPNPLGLFDMLGNVSEWVLEPYRLNKVGRPHGLAGGMVARGGDFQTPESQIRSSLRTELPPLDANGEPLRLRTVGVRPALATVATTSEQRPAALREEFERAAQSRERATEDPARLLDLLKAEATDPAQRQGIERVGAALRSETRARREQESQAIRSQIAAAAQIGRQIVLADAYRGVLTAMAQVQADQLRWQQEMAESQGTLSRAAREEVQAALRRQEERTRQNAGVTQRMEEVMRREAAAQEAGIEQLSAAYLRTVLAVGRSADSARIAEEASVVFQEFQAANAANLAELARLAVRHMQAVATDRPPMREQVVADLLAPRGAPPPSAPAAPRQGAPLSPRH